MVIFDEEDRRNIRRGAAEALPKVALFMVTVLFWFMMTSHGEGFNAWLSEVGSEGFSRGTALTVLIFLIAALF